MLWPAGEFNPKREGFQFGFKKSFARSIVSRITNPFPGLPYTTSAGSGSRGSVPGYATLHPAGNSELMIPGSCSCDAEVLIASPFMTKGDAFYTL
jgi:hypothetical protein